MPLYTFVCPKCGSERDEIVPMAERDAVKVYCTNARCGDYERGYRGASQRMARATAYRIATKTNEASVWPQRNDALVPVDPKMEAEYRRKGWLVDDGFGGETVKVESEYHYKAMMADQGLVRTKMGEDYERPSRSRAGTGRRFAKPKARFRNREQAKEKARKELIEKGVRGYGVT